MARIVASRTAIEWRTWLAFPKGWLCPSSRLLGLPAGNKCVLNILYQIHRGFHTNMQANDAARPLPVTVFIQAQWRHDRGLNRPGNRGGWLVKVKQVPQPVLQVVDSNALRLRLAGCHRSIPIDAGG